MLVFVGLPVVCVAICVSDDVYMYLNFTSSERGPSQSVDGPCCAMLFANLQINMQDRPKKWGQTHDS